MKREKILSAGSEIQEKQKLFISLDEATTARYLVEASKKTEAEINADCMPSGAQLRIDICPPLGNSLFMLIGNEWVEIGEVDIKLKTVN